MTLIYVSLAFIAGIFFHKVYSAMAIIIGFKSHLMTTVENEIIEFMLKVYTRLIMSLETGYITMQSTGVSEETIKRVKNEDAHDLKTWKKEVMNRFVESYPQVYKSQLLIENWDDAMQQLSAYKQIQENRNEGTD
jgi:preprotein translocase subunit SecF